MVIFVMGQEEALRHAAQIDPTGLLSILDPGPHPPIPTGGHLRHHLHLEMHDVWDDRIIYPAGYVSPAPEHIEAIIDFGRSWTQEGPLLIHCMAGVSRSTAAALTILSAVDPAHEVEYAQEMRIKGPWIAPNLLMIRLADHLLGRQGELIRAVAALPEPTVQGGTHLLEIPLR